MSLIKEACSRVGADCLQSFCDSNGYQGTTYYLCTKDGKYGIASLAFGTCALCDWRYSLEDQWEKKNGYDSKVPLEAYEPIILSFVDQLDTWYTKEEFLAQTHMMFGVGYTEEAIEEEVCNFLKEHFLGS